MKALDEPEPVAQEPEPGTKTRFLKMIRDPKTGQITGMVGEETMNLPEAEKLAKVRSLRALGS